MDGLDKAKETVLLLIPSIKDIEARIVNLEFDDSKRIEIVRGLMKFEEDVRKFAEAITEGAIQSETSLKTMMDRQQLTLRTATIFLRAGYKTLEDVSKMTEEQAKRIRNCGVNSLKEIKRVMEAYGLNFKEGESHELE